MEAIKGRGMAGAQLTASGAGEEGDMDQDPHHCREEQVNCREEEVSQFVQLPAWLSGQTWPVCPPIFPSILFI